MQNLCYHRSTPKVSANKFLTAPNVLVCNLPQRDDRGLKRKQLIKVHQELDLRRWMHPSSPELQDGVCLEYDLAAMIVHKGTFWAGGHYIAFCRQPASGESLMYLFLHSMPE